MVAAPVDGPEGLPGSVVPEITAQPTRPSHEKTTAAFDEKNLAIEDTGSLSSDAIIDDAAKIYVPEDNEEFIDPRLKNYPIPLVAKTVDLHNDFK